MAKINGLGAVHPTIHALTTIGNSLISSQTTAISDPANVGNVIGVESYAGIEADGVRIQSELKLGNAFDRAVQESQNFAFENLTPEQRKAGAIVLMAKGDLEGYARASMVTEMPALESGDVDAALVLSGAGGVTDYNAPSIAMEYFNETSLDKHLASSFAFNVQAARQSSFSEGFFRTIVVDPTECGMLIEIKKTMVFHAVRHSLKDKDNSDYERRNILDSATDPTVLEDRSIDFVPHYLPDDSNSSNFVSKELIKPYNEDMGDYSILTAPLLFNGEDKRLLSLSAHPGLVNSGILDESDELDGRVALKSLYFKFNKVGAAESEAQLVRMSTLNLARASFNKTQEGDGREMSLNFRDAKFSAGAGTKSVVLEEISALEEIIANRWSLQFSVKVNANINLQTGKEDASATKVTVTAVIDENGEKISLSDPSVKVALDAIKIVAEGYKYKATRSNSNKRTKGLLIDHVVERERYKITLGSPLTSRKPTGTVDDSQRLNDLITAARARNDNLAITKLLNYTEALEHVYKSRSDDYEIPSIEGVGRHYVAPWFEEFTFNVPKMVQTLDSTGSAANLANSLLSVIREQVVRAFMQSRFQPAIEMLSGYTISKPRVTIGTDVETANWLWVEGDTRTLGNQFEYTILTTNDIRFRGRIQWVFTIDASEGGFSPLNFGNHLWVPELVTNTNLTRNDSTTNELTVQPRNYHIVNVPITGVVNVIGLQEFVNNKPSLDVVTRKSLDDATGESVLPDLDGK